MLLFNESTNINRLLITLICEYIYENESKLNYYQHVNFFVH